MDKIIIIDDFFSEDIIKELTFKINKFSWNCECYSRPYQDRNISYSIWCVQLYDDIFFSNYLNAIIINKIKKPLVLSRVMAIAQPFGYDICYHTDHSKKNKLLYDNGQDVDSNEYTFCLYLNYNNTDECGGNINFKIPNEKYIISIEPIFNRGIFFPAYLLHSPRSFDRSYLNPRLCVTWKYSNYM
jgi:hypothetical protein